MPVSNARVNFYMNPDLLERLDAHAAKLGLSRSAAITVIIYEYFRSEDATSAMGKMNELNFFEAIADNFKINNA